MLRITILRSKQPLNTSFLSSQSRRERVGGCAVLGMLSTSQLRHSYIVKKQMLSKRISSHLRRSQIYWKSLLYSESAALLASSIISSSLSIESLKGESVLPLFAPSIPVKKVTSTIYNSSSTTLFDRIPFTLWLRAPSSFAIELIDSVLTTLYRCMGVVRRRLKQMRIEYTYYRTIF